MTTKFRITSVAIAIFAIASFGPQLAHAEEKLGPLVITTKPKLNAGQFISNCQTIGGNVTDGGSNADGSHSVNCSKDNGLNVSCDFHGSRPTECVGSGPRPQ